MAASDWPMSHHRLVYQNWLVFNGEHDSELETCFARLCEELCASQSGQSCRILSIANSTRPTCHADRLDSLRSVSRTSRA